MGTYTIFGYYEDTSQVFTDTVEAEDQYQAMGIVGSRRASDSLVLIGAVHGSPELMTPDNESDLAVYAVTMEEFAP